MHHSKICFKCNLEKPLSDFYKHKQMGDGHLNKCKECTKKDSRENLANNADYYREYEKSRANLPHRVEARKRYSQTEEGKKKARASKEKWTATNVIKKAASQMVNNAVRDGKLHKSNFCEVCNKKVSKIHGHHDDYSLPLVVRWLCSKCHTAWHKINGSGLNG